jgi:predicted ATPase/DNA-binding CsgD family transcriptional regulator
LTSFVGRRLDQAEVRSLLCRARLVTLIGPGGSGKTRLALRVARTFEDTGTPVRWAELAPAADPDGVLRAVMNAVGARDDDGPTAIGSVAAALGSGAVLVLDNCEHQLDAVSALARELLAAEGVRILATSREPIGIGGEAVWDVGTLPVPEDRPDITAEDVLATDAGLLFVERARAANRAFRLHDAEAAAVGRLIRRLDGLPLALELAAVRCRALGPSGLADALDDRFSLLVGSDRTADPRHRTLLASVGWSHDLLSEVERTLLRRLAAFAGAFTARAAEAVAPGGDLTMGQVLPALLRLVERSLVVRVPSPGADRYRLLETIRAFALERLDDAGERDETLARHTRFFTMRAAAVAAGMDDRLRNEVLPVVDLELADLDQARVEALAAGEPELAATITADLTRYWCARGHYRAGIEAHAQVLPHAPQLEPLAAARLLWGAAHLHLSNGDVFTAGSHALNAVRFAREAGDPGTLARALAAHGGAIAALDPAAAAVIFQEAADLARAAGDRWALGAALSEQAMSMIHVGRGDRAVEELAEAQEIGTALGDSSMLAFHAVAVGWLANRDGEFVAAERHLREAIALAEEAGDQTPIDLATGFLAEALAWQGRPEDGVALLQASIAHLEHQPGSNLLGVLRLELGNVQLLAGRPAESLALFEAGRAHPVVQLLGYLHTQADLGIGASLLALGRPAEALEPLQRAVDPQQQASPWVRSMGQLLLGDAKRQAGDGRWLPHSRAGLELAVDAGFGAVEVEGIELFAAEAAAAGGERAVIGARLLGAARSARVARGIIPAVPGLSRGAEAEASAVAALGEEAFAEALADGSALGLGAASRLALSTAAGGERSSSAARAVTGWESLTPAELRVAQLAARGLSNPRIAEDLYLSRETVKSHLSRIFVKVGLSGRAELAAAWASRD